jgi:hypothetical protein
MDSVQSQIQTYLERHYPEEVNGGILERMTFLTSKQFAAKPSNVNRRLRELAADGKIIATIKNGSVWYKAKHGLMFNGIPVYTEKAAKTLAQKLLLFL